MTTIEAQRILIAFFDDYPWLRAPADFGKQSTTDAARKSRHKSRLMGSYQRLPPTVMLETNRTSSPVQRR